MTRKDFIKMCGLLGIGLPAQSTFQSCSSNESIESPQKVIIIGAGAAGLTAGYLLNQQGIDFTILEASSTYGGRMKRTTDFADFPIPLGAEWLHVERDVFEEIVNDPSISIDTQTVGYDHANDKGLYQGMEISTADAGFGIDQKFIGGTWFDFFEEYVTPSVKTNILYNKIVNSIDYTGDLISIKTSTEEFTADRVIVAVPVKMLQNSAISFNPSLPTDKATAINEVTIWDGCKAFIQFTEKFYPTVIAYDIIPESAGQKLYYDAAYGQNSSQHILGLFAVGTGTLPYVELTDSDLIDFMLAELDEMFDGKATPCYVNHIFQNWNKEPFANGAYIYDEENWRRVRTLGESIGNRVLFAGDAYTTGEDWSSVHTAARSAIRAVQTLIG